MFFDNHSKSVSELRNELIDDSYALAIGGGCPAAFLEVSDIERMSDEEVISEAKKRGLI